MAGGIVVVGSLNMDLVVQAPRIPRPGETIIGAGDLQRFPGGKGANQAFAAARLGARVAMVGRVGEDDFADPVVDSLATVGVDTTHVARDPEAATGVGVIVVDAEGQNSIVVSSGANASVDPGDLAAAEATIAGCDLMLLQLEIPLPTIIAAATMARDLGLRVVLNPAPAQELPTELLRQVDVLVPNESETALLTGHAVDTEADVLDAAAALRAYGVDTVIVTRGDQGSSLIDGDRLEHFPAFEIDAVDTTAAGDAFIGGFAVASAAGTPVEEAIRQGNAAGALASTVLGAQTSLPDRAAVDALMRGG